MPGDAVCLTLEGPADLPCLERVHGLVDELWAQVPDVELADRYAFETAVIEVAGNIVEHGSDGVRLRLHLLVRGDRMEARLRDTGARVELDEVAGELPDELAEQGRGIALARAAVDDITYERARGANLWRVLKRRRAAG